MLFAAIYLLLFLLFSVLSYVSADPLGSRVFVRVCGAVLSFHSVHHGCAYTLLADGQLYRVFDMYRSCLPISPFCVVARPSGDGSAFRPLFD